MVDISTPLYRYLSFERFNQMLFSKELAIINPSKWDDQCELYWMKMLDTPEGEDALEDYAKRFPGDTKTNATKIKELCQTIYRFTYCLCFSKQKDAEVLWRARGNDSKGIMFATNAEKMLALLSGMSKTIEVVNYDLEANKIEEFLASFDIFPEATSMFGSDGLFLHKRKFFSYEEEIRLLVWPDAISENNIIKVPIPDLHSFVDGVMVHPLAEKEQVELVEMLCRQFALPFWGRSEVYDFAPH